VKPSNFLLKEYNRSIPVVFKTEDGISDLFDFGVSNLETEAMRVDLSIDRPFFLPEAIGGTSSEGIHVHPEGLHGNGLSEFESYTGTLCKNTAPAFVHLSTTASLRSRDRRIVGPSIRKWVLCDLDLRVVPFFSLVVPRGSKLVDRASRAEEVKPIKIMVL
jgi:hypothetical protein